MKTTIAICFIICLFSSAALFSQDTAITMTQEMQQSLSPVDALKLLKEGNKRFVNGTWVVRDYHAQIQKTSEAQFPFATVLSCMDSRTPSELIFDKGLGDMFNIGIAGNIANKDILGSLEYGSKVIGAKIIVVLGHTDCGAVKGAIDKVEMGNLTGLLDKIEPIADAIKWEGEKSSKDKKFLELVTKDNVLSVMKYIRDNSPILKEMEDKGEIDIVGGMYDISTGVVTFYE